MKLISSSAVWRISLLLLYFQLLYCVFIRMLLISFIFFIQYLSDTRIFNIKLNLRVPDAEITFIFSSRLNKSVLKTFSESGIILSYVYCISSHFINVPNLGHGRHA